MCLRRLQHLNLTCNRLGSGAAEALAAAAHHLTQLQSLDLSCNPHVGLKAAQALAAAGCHWTQLTQLRLRWSDCDTAAQAALEQAVPHWEGCIRV
jgi:Ran GTPase-activating protein (RanGAP) involved in mRNA processing and transport